MASHAVRRRRRQRALTSNEFDGMRLLEIKNIWDVGRRFLMMDHALEFCIFDLIYHDIPLGDYGLGKNGYSAQYLTFRHDVPAGSD